MLCFMRYVGAKPVLACSCNLVYLYSPARINWIYYRIAAKIVVHHHPND